MTVEPIPNEFFRFYVHSEDGNGIYLVDLEERSFNGECSCPHFCCRLAPKLIPGKRGKATRCKHILAARDYAFDEIAIALSTRGATR